jgi:hypothetical protein
MRDDALRYPEASRRTVDRNGNGRVRLIGIDAPVWYPFASLGLAPHLMKSIVLRRNGRKELSIDDTDSKTSEQPVE